MASRSSAALEERIARLEAEKSTLAAQVEATSKAAKSLEAQRDALVRELSATHDRALDAERERDLLRAAHERLRQELELLTRRLVVAKAERVDTAQLELEFAEKLRALEEVAGTLEMRDTEGRRKTRDGRPSGRRDLRALELPEERIEIPDPLYESLVAEGKAVRHGFEESVKLMRKRGGMRRVVVARVKYKRADEETGRTIVVTTERPKDLLGRSIVTASLAAHIISMKVGSGMPLYRLEDIFLREGVPLDRATMSRLLEDLGATFGATVVHAMRLDAMQNAFCVATDATGIKIQPVPRPDRKRQPCKRAHALVLLADRDHAFFDYLERETSEAIAASFAGFKGFVQADAKSVYDVLYRARGPDDETCTEVGCWSHARRKFWEATTAARSEVAREGLARMGRIFELDATWADKGVHERHRLRRQHLRPHVEDFFRWCRAEQAKTRERGLLATALGYAVNQEQALTRFFDDGRLGLENNRSERALRKIAIGRKNWLFSGSDGHAASLCHLFTLEASARLHGLDPEAYLRDLIRVLPHWPRERYLERCPRDWTRTRARLDLRELEPEVGAITVPD